MLTALLIFILSVADELRPNLGGSYRRPDSNPEPPGSAPEMHTPALDNLALNGAAAGNAFASQPNCGPSRACIMAGRRPDSTLVR